MPRTIGTTTGSQLVGGKEPPRVLRFLRSERFLHWALAVPFVLLYASALAMLLLWSEPQPRHIRAAVAWGHRIVGLALLLLPPIALLRGRSEWRTHLANLKEGWTWSRDDLRWLILFPKAALDDRVTLPDQGKFNAAEKLNFMMVSVACPLYIITGLLIWMPGIAFVPWLAHCAMAVAGIPLVAGHIVMATINPGTRIGLSGMITGWVDREWAKHHYRRWYREQFEKDAPAPPVPDVIPLGLTRARVRCNDCQEVLGFESWEQLLQRMFQVEPLFCPACRAELGMIDVEGTPEMADSMLRYLERVATLPPKEERIPSSA
jgi:formate dehydrogenase subunit gamma